MGAPLIGVGDRGGAVVVVAIITTTSRGKIVGRYDGALAGSAIIGMFRIGNRGPIDRTVAAGAYGAGGKCGGGKRTQDS